MILAKHHGVLKELTAHFSRKSSRDQP